MENETRAGEMKYGLPRRQALLCHPDKDVARDFCDELKSDYGKYKRENVTLIVIDIHFELYVISLGELKISVNPSRAV